MSENPPYPAASEPAQPPLVPPIPAPSPPSDPWSPPAAAEPAAPEPAEPPTLVPFQPSAPTPVPPQPVAAPPPAVPMAEAPLPVPVPQPSLPVPVAAPPLPVPVAEPPLPVPVAADGLPVAVTAPAVPASPGRAPSAVLSWVQAGAGVVVAVSTFLPWVNRSVSGIDVSLLPGRGVGSADGFGEYPSFVDQTPELVSNTWAGVSALVLGLGIAVVALLGLRLVRGIPAAVPLALAGALLVVSGTKIISILGDVGTVGGGQLLSQPLPSYTVEAGFGLWALLAASLVAFFAALLPVLPRPAAPEQLALPH